MEDVGNGKKGGSGGSSSTDDASSSSDGEGSPSSSSPSTSHGARPKFTTMEEVKSTLDQVIKVDLPKAANALQVKYPNCNSSKDNVRVVTNLKTKYEIGTLGFNLKASNGPLDIYFRLMN